MQSLCSSDLARGHLAKLEDLVKIKALTGTQAWSFFSAPAKSKVVTTKDKVTKKESSETFDFSLEEIKTYKALRQATQKLLFERYGRVCSYCRRPVGHYGISWHIEHVLPKSKYPALTFDLSNLTIGCVDCNFWKGRRVDPHVKNKKLPIINPLESNFQYSNFLQYLQIGTEDLSFTKYLVKKSPGPETYKELSFAELERAQAVDSVDPLAAALHERIMRTMSEHINNPDAEELLTLLGDLKTSIYRRAQSEQ